MNKYTAHFEVNGISCEIDFRAACNYDDAPAVGAAIVAGIPGAEYGYTALPEHHV